MSAGRLCLDLEIMPYRFLVNHYVFLIQAQVKVLMNVLLMIRSLALVLLICSPFVSHSKSTGVHDDSKEGGRR